MKRTRRKGIDSSVIVSILLPLETGHEDLRKVAPLISSEVSILLPLETGHEA